MKNLRQVKATALTRLKTNLKMKLSVLFLVSVLFQVHANSSYAQKTKISLNLSDVPIEVVLDEIQKQSEFRFLANVSEINLSDRVSVFANKKTIKKILTDLFRNRGVNFEVAKKQIILTPKIIDSEDSKNLDVQQTINGNIKDADGIPLAGVNILVEGTNRGTQTDFDGNYQIEVSKGDVLVFSFLGLKTQSITVGDDTTIDLVMEEDTAGLDEVVIVGYGQRSRKSVVGAVEQISGEVLENRPITNLVNGLQGVLPGLTVTRSSGRPGGEGYQLNVRGLNSINAGNSPLILVDGVEGDINLINPNDIKSVTVLKDASAAIYGARAAGGVILITTKTGKKNQAPKVTLVSNYSINTIANLTERVDQRQWVLMDWEAKTAAGAGPQFAGGGTLEEVLAKIDAGADPELLGGNSYLFYREEDWDKALFDNGTQKIHNATISGGGERTDYLTSIGFTRTDGILRDAWDYNERINMRFNHGYDITDRLRIETRLSYDHNRNVEGVASANEIFNLRNKIFTWLPIRTQSGENYTTQWGFGNPRERANKEEGRTLRVSEILRGNFLLNYKVTNDLTVYTQAALNRTITRNTSFAAVSQRFAYNDNSEGFTRGTNSLNELSSSTTYRNYTAYLDYVKQLGNKHNISLTAGLSHEESENSGFTGFRDNFSQTEVLALGLGSDENVQNGSFGSDWAIKSYFGRFVYTFNSKYTLEGNYRRDGTSVFSPNKRWGNFGGVTLSWLASDESFIKNLNVFDYLKFRVSQGTTGNQNLNAGNVYDYIPIVDIAQRAYLFSNFESAARERRLVSQDRTWEDLKTTNIGVDFAFFNSKLSGSFDVFKKENSNMLLPQNAPGVLGGQAPQLNIGALETKGFELILNWTDSVSDDFSYNISFNLSDDTNILTNLDGRDAIGAIREGYALNTQWGWAWDGIIQNQVELNEYRNLGNIPNDISIGDARYKDLNGDGIISLTDAEGNDADVVNLGTNQARFRFGSSLGAKYKNWDFSALIQGVAKRTIFYSGDFAIPFSQPWWQPLQRFYNNTWTPDNPRAKYPRLTTAGIKFYNYRTSENTRVSGAYARLKNITFGYTLPTEVLEKVGVSNLRIYVSGEDLFTLDAVDGGYDAENTNGSSTFYPFTKRYSLGLTLTF